MRNVLLRSGSCSIRGTSTLRGLPVESAWTWVWMLTGGSWRIPQITDSFGKNNSQFTCDKVIPHKCLTQLEVNAGLLFVLSDWCNNFSVICLAKEVTTFLSTNQKGTSLSTCISNTTAWTAMTGCWGWCAVVWRSGPSTQDTSKPRPASFPASAQSEPARGSMSEEQTTTDRWPTLWRRSRWLRSLFCGPSLLLTKSIGAF